jgi:hypothetical protein
MRPLVLLVVAGCASGPVEGDRAGGRGPHRAITAEGEVTWTAAFDDAAHESGLGDCSYTRRYTAVEDRSTPWLCPECDVILVADVEVSEEGRACYRSITGADPPEQERIGWSADTFYRTTYPFGPLHQAGFVEGGADAAERVSFVEDAADVELTAGSLALGSEGSLSLGTTTADPWHGMLPPEESSCGWPRSSAPAWDGPWRIKVGRLLPDGWFGDACGESVRLHDFFGSYLVVEVSAMDCGPCQMAASDEEAFVGELRSLGIPVTVVTLLAPSLEAPVDPTPPDDLDRWSDTFDLHGPVLGDRGWGYALAGTVWPATMAYPSWFVTAPNFEVLAVGQGYDGFQGARAAITAHRFGD